MKSGCNEGKILRRGFHGTPGTCPDPPLKMNIESRRNEEKASEVLL